MIELILSMLIYQTNANSSSYNIQGNKVNVFYNKDLRITSSIECKLNSTKSDCENFDFIKKLTSKSVNKKIKGGVNLGAEICVSILKGESLIGTDSVNNQMSFCKINEKLYVDNGSLEYLADRNDGIVIKSRSKFHP